MDQEKLVGTEVDTQVVAPPMPVAPPLPVMPPGVVVPPVVVVPPERVVPPDADVSPPVLPAKLPVPPCPFVPPIVPPTPRVVPPWPLVPPAGSPPPPGGSASVGSLCERGAGRQAISKAIATAARQPKDFSARIGSPHEQDLERPRCPDIIPDEQALPQPERACLARPLSMSQTTTHPEPEARKASRPWRISSTILSRCEPAHIQRSELDKCRKVIFDAVERPTTAALRSGCSRLFLRKSTSYARRPSSCRPGARPRCQGPCPRRPCIPLAQRPAAGQPLEIHRARACAGWCPRRPPALETSPEFRSGARSPRPCAGVRPRPQPWASSRERGGPPRPPSRWGESHRASP